jgi:hypothetical protein
MNKRIDLSNLGGFPLQEDTLDFMQSSYRGAFAGIANMCGSKTILYGVQVIAGNVTDGWIAYNGELIPFIGGVAGADVVITELPNVVPETFEDGSIRDVYFTKTATCGALGDFPFTDLVPLLSLKNIWRPGDIKERYCDAAYIAANFDVSGYGINNEIGWRIFSSQVPASAGKVFVNLNTGDVTFNTIGNNGGEKTHTLNTSEMPTHTHPVVPPDSDDNAGFGKTTTGNSAHEGTGIASYNTGSAGLGSPHNNLQPYFVILKLVKL